jgi:hypothetical protein
MIKFGSRTELLIPMRLEPMATVRVGQKVRGAADVVAKLGVGAKMGGGGAGAELR